MTYYLYLKSHADAPDHEDECEASSKEEAVKFFMSYLGKYGWSKDMIEPNVASQEEIEAKYENALEANATGN